MQITPVSFWLMIVSIAIAVFPVPLSPMINSRCPRPIGIIESIALSPVCNGSPTGCRFTIPGATMSIWRLSSIPSIGPFPSCGAPSGSTTRPRYPCPTSKLNTFPVRRTWSPSWSFVHSPMITAPILSSSRLSANAVIASPVSEEVISSISEAIALVRP